MKFPVWKWIYILVLKQVEIYIEKTQTTDNACEVHWDWSSGRITLKLV